MIKGFRLLIPVDSAISKYVNIHGRSSYGSSGSDSDLVRWNGILNQLERFQNDRWYPIGGEIDLEFTDEFVDVLEWGRQKMEAEKELDAMINKYPEIKKMKEQLDLMLHLVKEHENEPNS